MTTLVPPPTPAPEPSLISSPAVRTLTDTQPSVLARITEPDVNLCVWQRRLHPNLFPAITAILNADTSLQIDLSTPTLDDLATAINVHPGVPASARPAIHHLANDIVRLTQLFSAPSETTHPRVRLVRVEDDGCALFHADTLNLRLLCTYAGPGTQWLDESNLHRDQLGLRDHTIAQANAAIVRDPSHVHTIPTGHVAIFKGRAHPGAETLAFVHRSTPVASPTDHRLRLCIDQCSNCNC